jgi:hypothetical protein
MVLSCIASPECRKIERAWQQHRGGARLCHRGDSGFLGEFQVVGRQCAKRGRERGALHVRQLLGVQLHADALDGRRVEYPFGLLARERDFLAEGVDRVHEPFAHERRQHDSTDFGDVVVGATGELRWQRVRAEEGGVHRDPAFLGQRARGTQLFAFVFERQTIAGFDFDRRDALGEQIIEAWQALGYELRLAGRARGVDCRQDAAALGRDLLIRDPVQSLHELLRAIA